MREQVRHPLCVAVEPHVRFQVIPFEKGAHAGMTGSSVHMDFPDADDPELVSPDTPAGDLFLESEAEIRRYESMFEHLQAVALGPADSLDLLAGVAEARGREEVCGVRHDPAASVWRSSGHSSGNGQCVEVRDDLPGTVPVRDGKRTAGPHLAFGARSWESSVGALKERRLG